MPAACRVLSDIRDDLEAEFTEQRAIVGFVEAGMIERLAAIAADGLPMARPAGEHQRRPGRGVRAEDRKHPALIIAGEMEEAVPRKNAVEAPVEGQRAHVRDHPAMTREAAL